MLAPVDLRTLFAEVRAHSVALAAPLSAEDCAAQSMPDASPVKWHLAHTTWFFETFILERFESGFAPFHQAFRVMFNSYYNGIGEKHPRAQRGLVTRPCLQDVLAYRRNVDARIAAVLEDQDSAALNELVTLGLNHEQQHQELILMDVQHLLSLNPLYPAYDKDFVKPERSAAAGWQSFDGGVVDIGHQGGGFFFDNEAPKHRQYLEPFELASRLVTNGDYLRFVEAGGYQDPQFWLAEGFDWLAANQIAQPLYWRKTDGAWQAYTLNGLAPLALEAPALHLSFFEASAYALWQGARLPSEAEWEHAAAVVPSLDQLFGVAWQWTSSAYSPYPGFAAAAGAVGEYNGKFMVNQYVLRGSSLATPPGHARATYRNFFPAHARWQFAGVRLAQNQ